MSPNGNLDNLLTRLRELEAESIRLAETDLAKIPGRDLYEKRLDQLEKCHSRSWFGDHATTYYGGFQSPPGGRSFDVEWGFIPGFRGSHNPGWRTYSRDEINAFVFDGIGEDTFPAANDLAETLIGEFSSIRDQALDIVEALSNNLSSKGIARYTSALENEIKPYTVADYLNGCLERAPRMTRDSEELAKGRFVPPHIQLWAPFQSINVNKRRFGELARTLRKTIEAVQLSADVGIPTTQSRTIFLGHGRSEQWRALKDFLKERLGSSYEEFNRISPAGIGTQERLTEMLNKCGFAFLVLTGEDVHADTSLHARENVIHEAGLFQGRLGWRKAIIVLEEGCEEFSNIVGLGQIRFAKGNISSCFEEIRRVLEREGLLAK